MVFLVKGSLSLGLPANSHVSQFHLSLLLLCGDVESNPGPRYPCSICSTSVSATDKRGSFKCNLCRKWVHLKCSGLNSLKDYSINYYCQSCKNVTAGPPVAALSNNSFRILQLNINGVSNKLTELGQFLFTHKIAVAAIQETKLSTNSTYPSIPDYSTVRLDRTQDSGGGLLFFIHHSTKYNHFIIKPNNNDKTMETLAVSIQLEDYHFNVVNIYIPPTSSCKAGYRPTLDHILKLNNTLIVGDLNAHSEDWHSPLSDPRGNALSNEIALSNSGVLNGNAPTRLPTTGRPTSPDVSVASDSMLSSLSWKTVTSLSSDHLPIILDLNCHARFEYNTQKRTFINIGKADWEAFRDETEARFAAVPLPTSAHAGEKSFREIVTTASKHAIPAGRHRVNRPFIPAPIVRLMEARDLLRSQDPTNAQLPDMNANINLGIKKNKQKKWIEKVETCARKPKELWDLVRVLSGKRNPKSPNSSIAFDENVPSTSSADIAHNFNRQFTSVVEVCSKKRTRLIIREVRNRVVEEEERVSFGVDVVRSTLKLMKNSKSFGPDAISMIHLKNLGPLAMDYLTCLMNLSLQTGEIPSIWKTSTVIPLIKAGKPANLSSSYRPISLLCPAAKLLEKLISPFINTHLAPAIYQHGFRANHSTTTALMQIQTAIADGFNHKAPPLRTIMVCIDLAKAFDSVSIDLLIRKINNSDLQPELVKWISNYLRGRQSRTSFQDVTSGSRTIRAGVPQGSVISPPLFNFFLSDLPTPTGNVKIVGYADDLSIICSGVKIEDIQNEINNYLLVLSEYLIINELTLSAAKSTATLFTSDRSQCKIEPDIYIGGERIRSEKQPKVLGVTWDTLNTFGPHTTAVAASARRKASILKALRGLEWGCSPETLRSTYKAVVESVMSYAAPVFTPSVSKTNLDRLQTSQNFALRYITGCHMSAAIGHLHHEAKVLTVREHSDLLNAQYVAKCLRPDHPCHDHVTRPPRPRPIRETPQSRYLEHVNSVLQANGGELKSDEPAHRKLILSRLHTRAVEQAIADAPINKVLGTQPLPIHPSNASLEQGPRTRLCQLRSGECSLLHTYKNKLDPEVSNLCPECDSALHTTEHLFKCKVKKVKCEVEDLWRNPLKAAQELRYLL